MDVMYGMYVVTDCVMYVCSKLFMYVSCRAATPPLPPTPWYPPPPPVGWACGGTLSTAPVVSLLWCVDNRIIFDIMHHHCRRHLHHQYHQKNSCHHHHRHTTLIISSIEFMSDAGNYCADCRFLHGAGIGYHAGGGGGGSAAPPIRRGRVLRDTPDWRGWGTIEGKGGGGGRGWWPETREHVCTCVCMWMPF